MLVFMIALSKIMNMEGRMKITTNILMMAPLDIKMHKELIISIFE